MPRALSLPHSVLALILAAAITIPGSAVASKAAGVCEAAADRAAAQTGVPRALMRAVALVESGRPGAKNSAPWPWTVNVDGRGYWFDSRAKAETFVRAAQARGASSIDIGCFQINIRWHGGAFTSLEKMFDPAANAAYAARFLNELRAGTSGWMIAAGRYHSRTPEIGARYRELIRAALNGVAPEPAPPSTALLNAPADTPIRRVVSPAAPASPGSVALAMLTRSAGRLFAPRGAPLIE